MSASASKRFRKAIAMLCVAISFVFCVQMNVIMLDRLAHALGIDHSVNALAGSVIAVDQQHDHDQDDGNDPSHPVSHAHNADGGQTGVVHSSIPSSSVEFVTVVAFFVPEFTLAGGFSNRVDRPPKA
ncbi:MAG: hypothetical protein J0H17_09825 [Rhizobiales bacterium]|nr:hypothetical protein [Hyphomicrobiales bacterium]